MNALRLLIICMGLFLLSGCPTAEDMPPLPLNGTAKPSATQPAEPASPEPQPQPAVTEPQGQLLRQVEPGTRNTYHLYLPDGYKADRQWPMVVLLLGRDFPPDKTAAAARDWQLFADREGLVLLQPDQPTDAADLNKTRPMIRDLLGRWSLDRARFSYVSRPDGPPIPFQW